jgi:hypothetical protein
MRRLRELLRLKYDAGLSHRAIAQACAVGLGTVTTHLRRAAAAGLSWPLPDDLDDAALEARVFAGPAVPPGRDRVVPDWGPLHQELKKPGVTLSLLWLEYRAAHPTGYAYSQFCERYRRWARALKPSMRQVHRAGEKLFVDFSGRRPHLVDASSGEETPVELFVGVLGASGLIYAEATRSQDLPSWIGAHVGMLDYFQGSAFQTTRDVSVIWSTSPVAEARVVVRQRELNDDLRFGGATTGPRPTSWTSQKGRDAEELSCAYAFQFGSRELWKIGHEGRRGQAGGRVQTRPGRSARRLRGVFLRRSRP